MFWVAVDDDLREIRLPILIVGRSAGGELFSGKSVFAELLLLRSGDRFHHFCRDPGFLGRGISRSAQYPSGNQTHSQPYLGARGGSTEWPDSQPADDGVIIPMLLSFQSLMAWFLLAVDGAELMEFAFVRSP